MVSNKITVRVAHSKSCYTYEILPCQWNVVNCHPEIIRYNNETVDFQLYRF
jgi:hypothetical protein